MIKKIMIYASGEILVKGLSFLALPLYSHLISPNEYGTLGFLRSLVSFLPFILTFYYLYAYVRLSVEIEEKVLISTYFFLGIYLNIFYFSISLLLYVLFIENYNIDFKYFVLSIFSSSAIYLFQIMQMYYRSKGYAKKYIKVSTLYAITGLGFNFLFLTLFKDNVLAMLLSSSIITLIASIFAYTIMRDKIHWKLFDSNIVKQILKYSIPLVPGAISLLMFSNSDKIILINFISKDTLGIYTFAFSIGLAMSYIGNAFFMSYQPIFYQKISDNLHIEIKLAFWKNILMLFTALMATYFVIYIVYHISNTQYKLGSSIAYIIASAYCFMVFAQIMELHLTYLKKTSLVSFIYGAGSILTIIGLYIFIPIFGMNGAAFSLFISSFFISILMYLYAQKNLYISYNKFILIIFYFAVFALTWSIL